MRITRLLLTGAGAALFMASVYRAATYPFTHDEALSYASFSYEPHWAKDPNNHVLNTVLMRVCANVSGTSELSLRLPNVLALLLYLVCALLLLERIEHPVTRLAGFVLLALNPFALDFFAMARGYGLAMAFLMASLWLLVRGFEGSSRSIHLSMIAGALAVTASFVFVNAFVPMLVIALWLLVRSGFVRDAILAAAASGLFLFIIALEVLRLGDAGLLFFGGQQGLLEDTLLSLVRCTLYVPSSAEAVLVAIVLVAFYALVAHAILQWRKGLTPFTLLFLILCGAVLLPLMEHHLAGTRFPVERAALYYVPLFALTLIFALRGKTGIAISAAIVLVGAWHFARTFDVRTNYTWPYDAHDKDVLERIDRDRGGRNVRVGISWKFEPSLNHYRVTRGYTWLAPLKRDPIDGTEDYIYAVAEDAPRVPRKVLAIYPDTGTVLLSSAYTSRIPSSPNHRRKR